MKILKIIIDALLVIGILNVFYAILIIFIDVAGFAYGFSFRPWAASLPAAIAFHLMTGVGLIIGSICSFHLVSKE